MEKMKAGYIGFMDRNKDPWEQLEAAAKIGFKGTETGEMLLRNGNFEENKARMADMGMKCLTVSTMSGLSARNSSAQAFRKS